MTTFIKNQLILAKLQGHPWWPAYIKDIKENIYEVIYFGDFSKSFLKSNKIKHFDLNFEQHNGGKKLQKAINAALRIRNGESSL